MDGSMIDLGRTSDALWLALSLGVPGSGGSMNNLKELSVTRGSFQGNRLSVIQAKIIASDHMSVG